MALPQAITIANYNNTLGNSLAVQFDDELAPSGTTRFLRYFQIFSTSIFLHIGSAADTNLSDSNLHLVSAWERADAALTITTSAGSSVTIAGPAHSSTVSRTNRDEESYGWVPSNSLAMALLNNVANGQTVTLSFDALQETRIRASMISGAGVMRAFIQRETGQRIQARMASGVPSMRAALHATITGQIASTMASGIPTMSATLNKTIPDVPFSAMLDPMASAQSITLDICNGALTLVGTQLLRNVQEDNAQGYACRAFFDNAFSRALTRVPWLFARKNVELPESDDEDTLSQTLRGTHLYEKPDDFERMWTWRGGITPEDARVEGKYIRSAQNPPLPVTYIARVPVTDVPQSFIEIVQVILAESIKPRFSKGQVSADALSQRELSQKSMELIREASAIELSQISQPEQVGADTIGRGYGRRGYDGW